MGREWRRRTAAPPSRPGRDERAAPEVLIPGYVDPSGRDSLGRGLDAGSIAAVVAADRVVRQEREALSYYLLGAYRDPHTAKAQLDEMVKRQGWTSTAARIAQDPTQLGELHGRTGFFASGRAKTERSMAEGTARAIAPSLERIAAAEAQGGADLSGQRGSAAPGRRHPHSEAQRACRGGGCHARGGYGRQGPRGAMAQRDGGPGARSRAAALL